MCRIQAFAAYECEECGIQFEVSLGDLTEDDLPVENWIENETCPSCGNQYCEDTNIVITKIIAA